MATTTKTERGKTQIEVSLDTRRKLRLLAALKDTDMAEAAAEAISRALIQGRQEQAPALHVRIVQEGQLIADLPEWPYPVPRVGDYFFHPPPGPQEDRMGLTNVAGHVKTVTWRAYDRPSDPKATAFVMTAYPYVEVVI